MARSRRPGPRADSPACSATSRLHVLTEWLRSGRRLTTALAADALGVSRRTILRDIRHLRSALCLAVHYDPVEGTYTLDEDLVPLIPHPELVPGLLNTTSRPDPNAAGLVHLRFSRRSVQACAAARGSSERAGVPEGEGHLDLFYETSDFDALVRWILFSGAEVEVVAPESLRCRVVMEIRRMLDVYQPRTGGAA